MIKRTEFQAKSFVMGVRVLETGALGDHCPIVHATGGLI